MKLIDLKTKKAKFQPIKTPNNLELEYYKQLRFMVEQIHKRFENIVIVGMDKKYITEQIVDEDYTVKLKRLLKEFNYKINNQFDLKRLVDIADNSVNSVYNWNEIQWINRLSNFGIDLNKDITYRFLRSYLKMRVNSNVLIIKSLKDDVMSSLETMIYTNFEQGKTFKELAKNMTERLGIDKRRAVLIARNEIKNTNTQLTKKRMQEYGIQYAIWDSSEDERVRSEHRKFNGQVYEVGKGLWSNDLKQYVEVGEQINCRCVAIPLIKTKEEILKEYSLKNTEAIRE